MAQRQLLCWANVGTPTLGQHGFVNCANVEPTLAQLCILTLGQRCANDCMPPLCQHWPNGQIHVGPTLVYQCWPNVTYHGFAMREVQWILSLYMKPISCQSKASVVCSVTAAIFIDFSLMKLNVFSQHIGKKTNEYLNSAEQIPRNWNVDQLSVLITSWDITWWCSINLLWKELMERMSEHTGLISSYQLLITPACTNTGGKMKDSHPRAADRCPFVPRHI